MLKLILVLATAVATTQAVLPPADNLVVKDVPPPPLSLVDKVEKYTEFRSAHLGSWHPTKREMLISTRFADTVQVHSVVTPGAARRQMTFYKDTAAGGSYQPTDGKIFVFDKDKGGDEFFQKYSFNVETKEVTLLTDGKSRNTGGVWSSKGNNYAYGSTRRNGADVDLWIMNPQDAKSNRLLTQLEGGGWDPQDWSPNDKQILLQEQLSVNEAYLWLVDVETGKKTALTDRNEKTKIAFNRAKFSKDGKGVYVSTDKDSEFVRLAYIDLESKKYTYLTSDIKWDVDEFELSDDGTKIAVSMNEEGFGVLHLLDAASGKELKVPKLPAGQLGGLHWHKNNRDLGFDLETARAPSDVYSLDTTSGNVDRWTFSETGFVSTSDFAEPQIVKWKSFDNREISAFMYKPSKEKFPGKRPVIVSIHGGPESQFRPWFLDRQNFWISDLGIVMICPNVRGSTGYGKTYSLLDNGFKREDTYKDIGALLDWIKQQPDLDGERIMVSGGSYGGHMTLATSVLYSDKIRCALDNVGFSSIVTFLEHTEAYRRDLRRVEYGDERDPEMRKFLERTAPLNSADKIKKPLYIVQGKNDPRVPASEAEQMVEALKKSGTPVWFLMANDEGHGFRKKKNRDYLFYTTIEFMEKFLLN
ncbi:MAG: prolyl oligopeptidase family serine peptidase [Candidatus Melainabacteria bacterium]|nr:prolyl oligopeptidase family serine peptidase [Candidatus Melainabacteria bacterium]